jgi:hypothetical protein
MNIFIDGEFLMSCHAADADSALDAIDLEHNIADTHWTDKSIFLTTASELMTDEELRELGIIPIYRNRG